MGHQLYISVNFYWKPQIIKKRKCHAYIFEGGWLPVIVKKFYTTDFVHLYDVFDLVALIVAVVDLVDIFALFVLSFGAFRDTATTFLCLFLKTCILIYN